MSDSLEDIEPPTKRGASQSLGALDSQEFYFDDEPLEDILYPGRGAGGGPTSANLYLQVNSWCRKLIGAASQGELDKVVSVAERLGGCQLPMSEGRAMELVEVLAQIIRINPLAILPGDLGGLRPLLERLWRIATETGNAQLVKKLGTPLFRWYEHLGEYETVKQILHVLIDGSRAAGNRQDEGILINNLAFEYFLEGRYGEALHWFSEAVRLFDETGDRFERQNARANCLLCKLEIDEGLDLDAMEADIRDIQRDLDAGGHWQQRKPYILLARVEERRGNLRQAMRWARKALDRTRSEQSRYYDLDRRYLAALRKKFLVLMTGGPRN